MRCSSTRSSTTRTGASSGTGASTPSSSPPAIPSTALRSAGSSTPASCESIRERIEDTQGVMRAVLVSGARGFVGRHLLADLGERAVASEANVTDAVEVAEEVRSVRPAAVVHLAAMSSVRASWQGAGEVWRVNAVGTCRGALGLDARYLLARADFLTSRRSGALDSHPQAVEDCASTVLQPRLREWR